MVAADGGWRLSGFSFSVSADSFSAVSAGTASAQAPSLHSYADPYPPPWEELAKVGIKGDGGLWWWVFHCVSVEKGIRRCMTGVDDG